MFDALLATARAQDGTFTPLQAARAGVSHDRLDYWVATGLVERKHHVVYVLTMAPRTARQACWIAFLAIGEPCGLAGTTAAWWRGVSGIEAPEPPRVPQLIVPSTRTPDAGGLAEIRRVTDWPAYQWESHDGMLVASALDTVVTCAGQLSDAALLRVLQDLRFHGALDLAELAARRRRGLPGSAQLGRVLALYWRGHDSEWEAATFRVLEVGQLAPDHCNVIVVHPDGRRGGPYDGYYEAEAVGYELDSRQFHEGRSRRTGDAIKVVNASEMGVLLRRLWPEDVADVTSLLATMRGSLHGRVAPPGLRVEHLPGRSCPCGHRPDVAARRGA